MDKKYFRKLRNHLIGSGIAPSFAKDEHPPGAAHPRHFVTGTLFAIAFGIFCFYLIAFPINNLRIAHEYQITGTFLSSRFTLFGWWPIYLLSLNLLLGYLWTASLLNNNVPEFSKMHAWIAKWSIVFNFVEFVLLTVIWLFYCNSGYTAASPCNDIRWCCAFFATSSWCPNITPCAPDIVSSQLMRNDEFFQIWLWSLIFIFWSFAHRSVNKSFREAGVFKEFSN